MLAFVKSEGCVGGTAASGLPFASFNDGKKQIVHGIANELVERMRVLGGVTADLVTQEWIPFDAECLKFVATDMLVESGVSLLLNTFVSDTIVYDGKVQGIIIGNKGGWQALRGKIIIDCTGLKGTH